VFNDQYAHNTQEQKKDERDINKSVLPWWFGFVFEIFNGSIPLHRPFLFHFRISKKLARGRLNFENLGPVDRGHSVHVSYPAATGSPCRVKRSMSRAKIIRFVAAASHHQGDTEDAHRSFAEPKPSDRAWRLPCQLATQQC
jgi:hypothetical protein